MDFEIFKFWFFMKKNNLKFEEAMEKLEKIVSSLENENINLDEAVKLFEEGKILSNFCKEALDKAKKKVEIIKINDDKSFKIEDFK